MFYTIVKELVFVKSQAENKIPHWQNLQFMRDFAPFMV